MIQTALSFALGFLVAAALVLLVAPAFWRRAVRLTRESLEASMPLSGEELQARIDSVRAEHAMEMRRLEMKAEAIKKKAAQDLVEITRHREEANDLRKACRERDDALVALQSRHDDLNARLVASEETVRKLEARMATTDDQLSERMAEVDELSRLYEESSLTASTRQIELVNRESDMERLNETIVRLRNERNEAERAMKEAQRGKIDMEEAFAAERKRVAGLERKIERMMTTLSNRDEKLERREKEVERLKEQIKAGGGDSQASDRLTELEAERARLEIEVADLSLQLSSAGGGNDGQKNGKRRTGKAELERLQSRLTALTRENKKLRTRVAAASEETPGDDVLREQIAGLAAEVVGITAALEGPDSPIDKALSAPDADAKGDGTARPSLAERVRALKDGRKNGSAHAG